MFEAFIALFFLAKAALLLAVIWSVLLPLIRWVNYEPEVRHIRLLWIALWCGGLGFLILGIVSFLQVGRQYFN